MTESVTCRVLEGKQVLVTTDGDGFVCDESPNRGGDGLGPSSLELMLAAVGACTALEVKTLGAAAGLPLERVWVDVYGAWTGSDRDGEYRIRRLVRVRGEVGEEDLERIRGWAERCAIGGLLAAGSPLTTEVERV